MARRVREVQGDGRMGMRMGIRMGMGTGGYDEERNGENERVRQGESKRD